MKPNKLGAGIALLRVSFFLIGLGATGLFATSPASAQPPTVDAGEFKVGDKWLYKRARGNEFTLRVTEVNPLSYVTESTAYPGAKFYRDRHGTVTKIEGALAEGSPKSHIGWKWLDFPLSTGKKFKYSVEGSVAPFSMEVTIVKWEKISVPAGAFDALRIDVCYFNETSRWYGCGQEWWYAPEVKGFIRRLTPGSWAQGLRDTDFELVSFVPAP